MKVYNHFVGIDIGKLSFVVTVYGSKQTKEYENNPEDIESFLKDYNSVLSKGLSVLETTG